MAWLCSLGLPNNRKAISYGLGAEENHISKRTQKELLSQRENQMLRTMWLYSPRHPLEDFHLRVKARLAVIISLTMSL